jgi:hypothetical protein
MPPSPSQEQTVSTDVWLDLADKVRSEPYLTHSDRERVIKIIPDIRMCILRNINRLISAEGVNNECVVKVIDNFNIPTKIRPKVASAIQSELTQRLNVR